MTTVKDLRDILLQQPSTSAMMIVSLLSLVLVLLYWMNVCCEDTEDRPEDRIFIITLLFGLSTGSGAVLTTAFYQVTDNDNSIFVQLCSQLMFLSHSFIYSSMISFLIISREECKGMFIPQSWKVLQIFLINLPQICLSSQNTLCSRLGNMADDLMSVIYLTTMIITLTVLSSTSKSSATSASNIPSYIWCISLPSLSLWLGWLSLAFIFDQFYLQMKGAALSLLVALYIFLFLLSKISSARTFKNQRQSPYQKIYPNPRDLTYNSSRLSQLPGFNSVSLNKNTFVKR